MAEMLVDSTKLDACLDAEADAIRAKTGGSADIPFDFANNKGFADAIAAIPSGGGSGGATVVNMLINSDTQRLVADKTVAEIHSAAQNGSVVFVYDLGGNYLPAIGTLKYIVYSDGGYTVDTNLGSLYASTESDYPTPAPPSAT